MRTSTNASTTGSDHVFVCGCSATFMNHQSGDSSMIDSVVDAIARLFLRGKHLD